MAATFRFTSPQSIISLSTFLLLTSTSANAQSDQSVAFQINPQHTGAVSSPSLRLPFIKKWTMNFDGLVSYPLVADGRVFITQGDSGTSFGWAFEAIDPVQAWAYYGWVWPSLRRLSIAYDGGTVFLLADQGWVFAIDPVTNQQKWAKNVNAFDKNTGPITAFKGAVYFGGGKGWVYALNSNDGSRRWTYPVASGQFSSPAINDDGVYYDYGGPQIYKLHPITPWLEWQYNSGVAEPATGRTAAVYDNVVYAPVRNSIWRLNTFTGEKLPGELPATALPAFDSGRAYLATGTSLEARSTATLEILWKYTPPPGEEIHAPPIVINGNVCIGTTAGNVRAFDGATGALLWSDNVGGPIVATNEQTINSVQTGLGAGEGLFLVPVGRQLVCYVSSVYSLSGTPSSVLTGAPISVNWLVPGARPKSDWIGMFKNGADNREWLAYRYANGATAGTATFNAPIEPGDYEFRYLLNDGYTSAAVSGTFTVAPLYVTLTASPSTGVSGVTPLRVDFTAPMGRPTSDWIGLYKVGTPNSAYLAYRYVDGATSGSFTFIAQGEAGEYEFRYLLNGGYQSVAASNRITLTALNPSDFTLSATPDTVSPGGALSVSFTAPAGRSARDWIGLYRIGTDNRSYLWWRYTAGAESGTFNLAAPMDPGQYEFRYLLEDGYNSIKTSNTVTVQ